MDLVKNTKSGKIGTPKKELIRKKYNKDKGTPRLQNALYDCYLTRMCLMQIRNQRLNGYYSLD